MHTSHSQQNKHLDDTIAAYAIVKYKASRGFMGGTFMRCTEKKAIQIAVDNYDHHKANAIHSGVSILVVPTRHFDKLVSDFSQNKKHILFQAGSY